MTSHEYLCPSYRLRIIKKSSLDTICNRCEGKGWYRHKDSKILLVCGFYEHYIEECQKREEEEREISRRKR